MGIHVIGSITSRASSWRMFFCKTKEIYPNLRIRPKPIKILPTPHPNRILIHKPTRIRFIIPEEIVMQSRLTVGILVLQAEGLVYAIRYLGFLFQTTPAGVVATP